MTPKRFSFIFSTNASAMNATSRRAKLSPKCPSLIAGPVRDSGQLKKETRHTLCGKVMA